MSGSASAGRFGWMLEQPVCVPVWLSPAEQAAWFEELWGGVAALQKRYPVVGMVVRSAWWEQPGACELLASFCAWRARRRSGHRLSGLSTNGCPDWSRRFACTARAQSPDGRCESRVMRSSGS